jgi:hypothetical protein
VTTAKIAAILQLVGFLFGFGGLLGERRLVRLEESLRNTLFRVTSFEWVTLVVRKWRSSLSSAAMRKISMIGGIPIAIAIVVLYYYYEIMSAPTWAVVADILGAVLFLCVVWLFGNPLRDLVVTSYAMGTYIIVWIASLPVFAVIWVIWMLTTILVAIIAYILFIVVNILILPYRLPDAIVTRYKLQGTTTFIGFVLGLFGTILQVMIS